MPIKFQLSINDLRVAMLFASDDETRMGLNGIHIEQRDGEHSLIVATDGRRLAVIQSEEYYCSGTGEVTIDKSFIRRILKFYEESYVNVLDFEFTPPKSLKVSCSDVTFKDAGAVIEEPYPNWRKVIPRGERKPVGLIGFGADYLADIGEAAKLLSGPGAITFYPSEQEGPVEIAVQGCERFYLVHMPLRHAELAWFPQPWATAEAES